MAMSPLQLRAGRGSPIYTWAASAIILIVVAGFARTDT